MFTSGDPAPQREALLPVAGASLQQVTDTRAVNRDVKKKNLIFPIEIIIP
jgi:hypothetical protein